MDDETRIQERAHQLWQEAGQPEGRSDHFWHTAQQEFLAATSHADASQSATTEPVAAVTETKPAKAKAAKGKAEKDKPAKTKAEAPVKKAEAPAKTKGRAAGRDGATANQP